MSFDNFDDLDLADNPDPRIAVSLILDTSDSMSQKFPGENRSALEALDGGLDVLFGAINKDPLARRRIELSFVVYGTKVSPATPFAPFDKLVFPTLVPSGMTATGAAVNMALDSIEERKKIYRANGIQYYRPILMLISDGLATDSISEAAARVKQLEAKKGLSFFAVGVQGADLAQLSEFSNRGALPLDALKFDELFQWLSASVSAVSSSQPGDKVSLPAPTGWMEID